MLQYKLGVAAKIPVRLLKSADGTADTASTSGVVITLRKADGSLIEFSAANANVSGTATTTSAGWEACTGTALANKGMYILTIPAAYLDKPGATVIGVANAATGPTSVFCTVIDVVTGTASDVYGLLFGNAVQDQQVYGTGATNPGDKGKLISARLRVYDTAANANAAGGTGLLGAYSINAGYDSSGNLSLFKITG